MAAKIKRWTKQMKAIIDIVYNSKFHLTADEVFLETRKIVPKISLGTVYRNLNRLNAQGMISIVPKGPLNTFSKHPDTNAHFECDICHRLYCIPYAEIGLDLYDLSKKSGFQNNKCSLYMSGVCKECERNKNQ